MELENETRADDGRVGMTDTVILLRSRVKELERQVQELLPYKVRCAQIDLQGLLEQYQMQLLPQTAFSITPR